MAARRANRRARSFALIAFFAFALWMTTARKFDKPWFLRIAVLAIPLPWLAAEVGWAVAEYGRQLWAIEGVLPTFLGASSLTAGQLWTTIIGFTLLYGALAVIEVRLMVAATRKGPECYVRWRPTPAMPRPAPARTDFTAVPAE